MIAEALSLLLSLGGWEVAWLCLVLFAVFFSPFFAVCVARRLVGRVLK